MTDARVITLGETMALLTASDVGPLEHVASMQLSIGGAESNVAIALARLGTPVTWLGRVGNDFLGRRILRELRGEGVDVRSVVDRSHPTGLMLKEHRVPESTRVLYYRSGSAGSRLHPDDLDTLPFEQASILHLTGITPALSARSEAAIDASIEAAKSLNLMISFDVNHRPSLWKDRDPRSVYRRLAGAASIVFAGIDEARLLCAERPPDAREDYTDDLEQARALAHEIAALGPEQVIIKLGEQGCYALIAGQEYIQPAVAVRVIDTVGAGDAFVAGYLADLTAGVPASERLRTAVTVGAYACLHPGDWEGSPRRDELRLLHATEPVTR